MKNYSLTIVGVIVMIASQFAPDVEVKSVEVETILAAIGIIVAWVGRWIQGDISIVGIK
jgi:hypothetical protein